MKSTELHRLFIKRGYKFDHAEGSHYFYRDKKWQTDGTRFKRDGNRTCKQTNQEVRVEINPASKQNR